MKYVAFLYEYSGDSGYTAVVPDLPGCISEGDTLKEAELMITEAAELWSEGETLPMAHDVRYFTSERLKMLEIPLRHHTYLIEITG